MPGRLTDFDVARKLKTPCVMKRPCRYQDRGDRGKWGSYLMALMSRGSIFGFVLLILFALLLGTTSPAVGAEKFCSDPPYFGVNISLSSTTLSSQAIWRVPMSTTGSGFPTARITVPITPVRIFSYP
jgi:hypothetical protein